MANRHSCGLYLTFKLRHRIIEEQMAMNGVGIVD